MMKETLLVVDDDYDVLHALALMLEAEGYIVISKSEPKDVIKIIKSQDVSLVVTDLNFTLDTTSGSEGISLIQEIRKLDDVIPIVAMTGWGSVELAVEALQSGANDFVQKPWENERLLSIVSNQLKQKNVTKENQKLAACNELLQNADFNQQELVAHSPVMQQLVATLERVALNEINVLLTGENGTGKSVFARFIHDKSTRSDEQFVSVNMGAVTETLFESEMFGHVKGAFTDAKQTRIGRFELASNGTLFLDEIGNTPMSQQAKLLRVLEDRKFEKVGSSKTQDANVRLICATNADIDKLIAASQFRQDLLYRINTVEICIPPLRERILDIAPLAEYFLAKASVKYNGVGIRFSQTAMAALTQYCWPGNVRELSQVVERAHILSHQEEITVQALQLPRAVNVNEKLPLDSHSTLEQIEQQVLKQRLDHFSGDAILAAQSLGLSRSTFYRRLSKAKGDM